MKQSISSVLILIFILFTANEILAQGQYALEWSNAEDSKIIPYTWDCPSILTKECQKVRLDSKKNVIAAGSSLESGNFNFLVVKYANNGDLIWKKLIDINNGSKDYLTDIFIDGNNNIIITGFSKWSNDASKSVLIKLDSTGSLRWQRFFSDDYAWSFPQRLAVDSNGDIFLTGHINQYWDDKEMFVCKFDTDGNFVWNNIYSVDNSGAYQGLTVRIIDNYIISLGYFYNSISLDKRVVILKHSKEGELLSANETLFNGNISTYHIDYQGNSYIGLFGDFKTIKYDQSGNEKWSFEVPTNLPDNVIADEVQDIISDEEGNVYITGRHYGKNYGDTSIYTNGDLQINKISSGGNLIFSYRYENLGTNAFDGGNKLFLGKNDYLVVGGQSQNMYIATDYEYVAIVLNKVGNPVDTLRYHDQGDAVIKSVAMDVDLNFYVTGTGNGNTLTQKYSFSGAVSTDEFTAGEPKFKVFPNPFSNELYAIANYVKGLTEFKLFDAKGAIVYRKSFDDSPVRIFDGQYLPNGFYFYQITSGEITESGKLIKN